MIRHARSVWAEIDLAAISHNVATLATFTNTSVMAVVKADAYGHGSVPAAHAALSGGAERLAVALVEEAAVLRDAGIEAPILLLSEPEATAAAEVVDLRITPTVYTEQWADALAAAARGQQATVPVHLKIDTGMHRVGARPGDVVDLARRIEAAGGLILEGIWTHLAVADEADHPATGRQVELFDQTLKSLADVGIHPSLVHAANSAGALGVPEARRDFVRAGISI